MRILLETHHPAHIHFFKHAVRRWQERGDDVLMIARDRDVMRALLERYDDIPSEIPLRRSSKNRLPMREMIARQRAVASAIRRFKPDLVASLMGSYAQSARVFRKPSLVFTDSEFQHFNHRIAHPFATAIHTPDCFTKPLGPKQQKYKGYHELAFLHPDVFTADPALPASLDLEPQGFALVRLSAWNTLHDVDQTGIAQHLDPLIAHLQAQGLRVLLNAEENKLPEHLRPLSTTTHPADFHDLLAAARIVISEGASTASEAACLGVPALYINSSTRGYLDDQQTRYNLIAQLRTGQGYADAIDSLLAHSPQHYQSQRDQLIDEHINVTDYLMEVVDKTLKT